MLLLLVTLFGFQTAHADQLSDFGYAPAAKLIERGFKSQQENGIAIYKKDLDAGKSITTILKKNEYIADRVNLTTLNFARVTQINSSGSVSAVTLCTGYGKGSKKFTCRTQTAKYCKDLQSQITSGTFTGNLRKLQECASIADKIRFDAKEIQEANRSAMSVINDKFKMSNDEIENPIAQPTSIKDILEDHKGCQMMAIDKQWDRMIQMEPELPKPGRTLDPGSNLTRTSQ